MKTRFPSLAFAAVARATRSTSLAAGISPGQETPRSLSMSVSLPRSNSESGVLLGSTKFVLTG